MKKKSFDKAFTLVEVMISVAIVSLIMGGVLFNYSDFSDNLALSAATQEIVLDIRKAQTYGVSVKEVTPGGGEFDLAYGIYFNKNTDPTRYYLFVDKSNGGQPPNQMYDVGNGCGNIPTECVEELTLRNNVIISAFCDGVQCPPSGDSSIASMSITFLRPNPDATINFVDSGENLVVTPAVGKIVLLSKKGRDSTVTVLSTGQISIE